MQSSHPLAIAFSEVIVYRDNVHTFARNGVQITRQGRHQRFTFTRTHLGNLAVMQNHSTNELNVEMAHAERTFTCPHERLQMLQAVIDQAFRLSHSDL